MPQTAPCPDELLIVLAHRLHQEYQPDIADLLPCGRETVDRLRSAVQDLLDGRPKQALLNELEALIDFAHETMSTFSRQPNLCWRRLYTDACIFRSLASAETTDDKLALSCISWLDRAIVIAGAPGEGRLGLIYDLIDQIQSHYMPTTPYCAKSSHEPLPTNSILALPPSASSRVPHLESPPSMSTFRNHYSHQPFILTGYIRDWPAMTEHPWQSPQYLRSVSGPGRIVPIEIGNDYRAEDWTQEMMDWDKFLGFLFDPHKDTPVFYLAQHNLFLQFPKLRSDIVVPDYVYASLRPPPNFPDYEPPRNEEELVLNAWLGPKGTISPAHTDPYFNFYGSFYFRHDSRPRPYSHAAQVVGRKTVWLAPPSTTPYMYPYPPSSSNQDHPHNPAANTTCPSMSNTSRVDVFANAGVAEEESRRQYPLFWKHVVPKAMSVTLEPGDILFFPPGWWHALRSEDVSFSVSMWF
ncbi:hypothetical protein JAAARDRAFT_68205 [Jaapia argillacea MUCL 33604]|uniref:JmjC domain-containing protein n=1 Tax=Jaapia argillacea MUCL 33604 TaxID=933084 RepID=A0A067QAF7_9AGAM|nr:hypothetical protein JAAARDRAFT_68205 [Jaapia argillacea MUCL 33604]